MPAESGTSYFDRRCSEPATGRAHFPEFDGGLPAGSPKSPRLAGLASLVGLAVRREGSQSPGRTARGELLLGILTYYYAAGIYVSEEIAAELARNPHIARFHDSIFDGSEPAVALRRFRRANRVEIEHCLAEVLRRWSEPSEGSGQHACQGAGPFTTEARSRVACAIHADSCALDF